MTLPLCCAQDVEGYAGGVQAGFDAAQLQRLHAILSPFMLRRLKVRAVNALLYHEVAMWPGACRGLLEAVHT